LTVLCLKIAKKSEISRIELVSSSIDAELNGEHFIPAHQHSMSGDFYDFFEFEVYRKDEYG
jgi:serine phosphatase RsbU (regulator of sigma subunit)